MLCKKCVLPENKPDILLNEKGICNICAEYEKTKDLEENNRALETDFIKMLNLYKSEGEYDCLVMCSGGKDSTSALYYMKKRYKLNPLAFTFDHGFETEDAMRNIKNAVDILGVEFLFFKSEFMKEMFSDIVKRKSKAVICHLCSIWYMDLAFKTAAKFRIPVIIAGWTKGQSTKQPFMSRCGCSIHQPEFVSMARAANDFLHKYKKENPKYKDFPESMEEVLVRAKKRQKCAVLSPHWFLPFDKSTYVETIQKELKWKLPALSYPANSTNCYLNFLSVALSMKNYGYTHYHVEMSKMIRSGMLTREEALDMLAINFGNELTAPILEKLGCGAEDAYI
ncbi:MAG: 7-cyano-7-deazaguanine synthase [Candidatus Omnitrophica bacterium]|nr:7-cyano-7-deazaguanine synthase [Candidatus Omnitrophota bacterium]MDD5553342.1 7-cyano-7-deazaguanine synthase [Candidatus Omnitrophota bacterium]